MSRCFPFPPPGFEKKSTTDVGHLLKKEKDRERKHKKDKKGGEKRDGKEKKDRSEGKNKDKKGKNKKGRENKERDKDKDRTNASYEKKVNLQLEHNANNNRTDEKKHLGKSEGGNGELFTQKGKENDVVRKNITADKNLSTRISGHNHDKCVRNNHFSAPPEDAAVVQQSGRKIKDDDRGNRSLLDENKATDTFDESKEKNMKVGNKRLSDQGFGDELRFTKNVISENLSGTTQTRIGLVKPPEEVSLKKIDGKRRTKQKESDHKHGKDSEKKKQAKE